MQGNNGHFFFSPNLPMNADAVRDSNRVFHEICRPFGVHWGWASMANVFPKTLTIIKDFNSGRSVHDNKRNRELVQRLIEGAAEHGWSEYRTPAAFQDIVMKGYSFNNHALLRFHETVKDALDPHGILAAGKSGIWPKHLREQRK
jgi:4-cresol dehydrogenase (hydroxylating)